MPTQVGVSLRAAGRIRYYERGDLELKVGDRVVVQTARGLELGQVVSFRARAGEPEAGGQTARILRLASEEDLGDDSRGRVKALEALEVARERIKHHDLPMKMLDAETTLDGNKLVLYFDSESRVDFRNLVRDLAASLHKRIELHQVGARDRSALTGGLGPCGRECCCSSWTRELYPVSIKMAKEQNLSLNPTKISGSCGRLMCCLRYEYQAYRDLRREMPRVGEVLTVPEGEVRVVAVHPTRFTLKVEHPQKGILEIPCPRDRGPVEPAATESGPSAAAPVEAEKPSRPRRSEASRQPSGRPRRPEGSSEGLEARPRAATRKPRPVPASGDPSPAAERGTTEPGRPSRPEKKRPRRGPKKPRPAAAASTGPAEPASPAGGGAAADRSKPVGRPRRKNRGRRPANRQAQPREPGPQ